MDRRKFISITSTTFALPLFVSLTGCISEKDSQDNSKSKVKDPKIEKLNLAIEHEFGAIVQYCNHAGITENYDFKKVIPEIISQEVNHAITLSNIIKDLGYKPTISLWPPQTGNSFSTLIEEDINAEKNAIELYEEIVKLDFDIKTKKIIHKIIKHEETHLKIFKNIKL